MKRKYYFGALILGSIFITSCEKESGDNTAAGKDYSTLLTDYTNNTVIATYAVMKEGSKELYDNVVSFKNIQTQADIDAACESWKSTRAAWEKSEAFLFGPAAYNNLDPLLDSWPLDQSQLEQVLAGSQELTADYVREGLGAVLRGFHTIEYLLFRNGENRKVADFTSREIDYLVAVTQVLRDDCITLWALWNGVEPGSFEASVLEDLEIEISSPYKDEFASAGLAGSRYTTQRDAVDEIVQGIMDIADEVANGKLAGPYTTKDVLSVESWHSWNSLTDFKNNIRSIQNAYLSSYNGSSSSASISQLVAEVDANLDADVKEKIDAALLALNNIGEPFRNNLDDDVNVPAAISAINDVFEIFEQEVKPAILK